MTLYLGHRASSSFGLYLAHAVALMNTFVVKNLIVMAIRVAGAGIVFLWLQRG